MGVEVVLKRLEEVARRGAAEGAGLDLEPERARHGLEVGLGLRHERVAVDGDVRLFRRGCPDPAGGSVVVGAGAAALALSGVELRPDHHTADEEEHRDGRDRRDHPYAADPDRFASEVSSGPRQNRAISLPSM